MEYKNIRLTEDNNSSIVNIVCDIHIGKGVVLRNQLLSFIHKDYILPLKIAIENGLFEKKETSGELTCKVITFRPKYKKVNL